MDSTTAFRLPLSFSLDVLDRGIVPEATLVHHTTRYAWLDLTDAQKEEVWSDAAHYSDPNSGFDLPFRLQAAAMLAALCNERVRVPKRSNRPKFVCPQCKTPQNVKPSTWPCWPCKDAA